MSKKNKTKKVKAHKLDLPVEINSPAYFHNLAHNGDLATIKKLKQIITTDKDNDNVGYAKIALEEAEYFYYSSNNKKEEKEFLLLKMIQQKEDHLFDLELKADTIEFELGKLDLDRMVSDKVLANNPKMKELPYGFSPDYYTMVKGKLADVESEIEYLTAWISTAQKMITTERYKNIPDEVVRHTHFDAEGDFWEEENENGAGNCDCGCESEEKIDI